MGPRQGQTFFGPVLDYASTPRADGTSPECTKLCQMVPSCSGYEVWTYHVESMWAPGLFL